MFHPLKGNENRHMHLSFPFASMYLENSSCTMSTSVCSADFLRSSANTQVKPTLTLNLIQKRSKTQRILFDGVRPPHNRFSLLVIISSFTHIIFPARVKLLKNNKPVFTSPEALFFLFLLLIMVFMLVPRLRLLDPCEEATRSKPCV